MNRMRFALTLFALVPVVAWAHGGGLDAKGCHTNRKTGEYHCHRAQTSLGATPSASYLAAPSANRAGSAVQYANCSEARAAGAAPVRQGDPGYSRKLDRDGDGVGCE